VNTLVVDASIAVKRVVEEDGTPQALALRKRAKLIAPELLVAECANILRKKKSSGTNLPRRRPFSRPACFKAPKSSCCRRDHCSRPQCVSQLSWTTRPMTASISPSRSIEPAGSSLPTSAFCARFARGPGGGREAGFTIEPSHWRKRLVALHRTLHRTWVTSRPPSIPPPRPGCRAA
jgi:hypothetical protein